MKTRWNFSRPAGFQRAAAQGQLAFGIEQGIVLRLVGKHRLVLRVEFHVDAGRQDLGQSRLQIDHRAGLRRHEVNAVGVDLDDLRAEFLQLRDHFLEQVAPGLRDARGGVVIGESGLGEPEVAIHGVD